MSDYKAQQAARAAASVALAASFPYLVPIGGKVDSLNAAAKNLRIELARAFPGVKFSVKSSRYSGGCSINVNWTDGPNDDQVAPITAKYVGSEFDSMQDLKSYVRSAWTDAFGDADYVFRNRSNSDRALESAIRSVKNEYAANLAARGIDEIKVQDFRDGKLYAVQVMENGSDYWSLQQIIRRVAWGRTWAINKAPKMAEMASEVAA